MEDKKLFTPAEKGVAIQSLTDDVVEVAGIAVAFERPGLDRMKFSKDTNFLMIGQQAYEDGFPLAIRPNPTLFGHGLDPLIGKTAFGAIQTAEIREEGLWVQAQLDRRAKYMKSVLALLQSEEGLGWSVGSSPYYVQAEDGYYKNFPTLETTLTPVPMQPATYTSLQAVEDEALQDLLERYYKATSTTSTSADESAEEAARQSADKSAEEAQRARAILVLKAKETKLRWSAVEV